MADFKKIKTMMVDKPVFTKADPNNPVHYQLKQKPMLSAPEPVVEAEPEEDAQTMFARMDREKQGLPPEQSPENELKFAKLKDMMKGMAGEIQPRKPAASPDFAPAQAKPLGPIASQKPQATKSSDPVDDKQKSHAMIDSILNDGPDDVERILNELDHIDEYELSDNDKRYVYNSIYEELRNQGRVDFKDEE